MLLVHHTATSNSYGREKVTSQIRSFHRYHTTTKGWPDVAYNFFVDRFGGIWEGRTGSLEGPVIGDATGGNQGHTQLCCFIGDHNAEAVTSEAQTSMISLLAFLASRYKIDPTPGATATFESRGSNRWPAGDSITSATIEGHRSMSQTTCPGDLAYPLVRDEFPAAVAVLTGSLAAPTTTAPTTAVPPTTTPTTAVASSSSEVAATTSLATPIESATSTGSPTTQSAKSGSVEVKDDDGSSGAFPAVWAGGGAVIAAASYLTLRNRRSSHLAESSSYGATDTVHVTERDESEPTE